MSEKMAMRLALNERDGQVLALEVAARLALERCAFPVGAVKAKDALESAIAKLERERGETKHNALVMVCPWRIDDDGIWNTHCGQQWVFEDGSMPDENGMRYCHSCGKRLLMVEDLGDE